MTKALGMHNDCLELIVHLWTSIIWKYLCIEHHMAMQLFILQDYHFNSF